MCSEHQATQGPMIANPGCEPKPHRAFCPTERWCVQENNWLVDESQSMSPALDSHRTAGSTRCLTPHPQGFGHRVVRQKERTWLDPEALGNVQVGDLFCCMSAGSLDLDQALVH